MSTSTAHVLTSAQTTHSSITSIHQIRQLVSADWQRVDGLIVSNLRSDIELISTICQHIVQSGGKRLRPLLTLLAASLCNYQGEIHIQLAVIIEFIHTATLLHDDVVDASNLRRGRPTANSIWGNQASILVGDFLYSRTFQLLTQLDNFAVLKILADTTNLIAEGEVLQLANRNNSDISEQHYLNVIRCKTAVLFSAAAELGAVIAKRSIEEQKALAEYGLHLGMAFQIIDDWLDYAISAEESGKNAGDDLADGKMTLPLIYALQHANAVDAQLIRKAIAQEGSKDLAAILGIIDSTRAFDYVHHCAKDHVDLAKLALQDFPMCVFHQALLDLAQLAIDRKN